MLTDQYCSIATMIISKPLTELGFLKNPWMEEAYAFLSVGRVAEVEVNIKGMALMERSGSCVMASLNSKPFMRGMLISHKMKKILSSVCRRYASARSAP